MTEERRTRESHHEYFEEMHWQKQLFVAPGEALRSSSPGEILAAETGSGVIITMHDPAVKVGAMAHILLPEEIVRNFAKLKLEDDAVMKTALIPLQDMINAMKQKGAGKRRIIMRLCGGSSLIEDDFDAGLKNAVFVQKTVMEKGLNLFNKDIGGDFCRRIHFFPYTGRLEIFPLRRKEDQKTMREREKKYLDEIVGSVVH